METEKVWRLGDAGRTVFGPPNGKAAPELIAMVRLRRNAPVLAAAPELLRELKALVALVTLHTGFGLDVTAAARTVIAKAEGKK